jgi:hypothetical protein
VFAAADAVLDGGVGPVAGLQRGQLPDGGVDEWTPDAITDRQKQLASLALKTWPERRTTPVRRRRTPLIPSPVHEPLSHATMRTHHTARGHERMFDTWEMGRQPIEHEPSRWGGGYDGHHIRHDGEDIPVAVRVQWDDGTESEHDGMTGQWTRTHVYVAFDDLAPMWVLAGDVRRR